MGGVKVDDLSPTIIPKSDQLNADQLLSGPITIKIADVSVGKTDEQPVVVSYHGDDGRPYLPCKTMRKLLIHAWGADGTKWVGRSITLYNDRSVRYGGDEVGGIRISHMTDIERDIRISLISTRGKKTKYEVARLVVQAVDHIAEIVAARDVDALRAIFAAAYRHTDDPQIRQRLKSAYDMRSAQLGCGK